MDLASRIAAAVALLLPTPALAAGDPETGHMLARQWCGGCHVVEPGATGGSDIAPPFTVIAADPDRTPGWLYASVTAAPHPVMPNLDLTRQEAADIDAYLDRLAEAGGAAPPLPGSR
ncbi:MAG TPA: hypothetical protein VFG47_09395 [Geminicoccaceae bacterium]|nr:hypothetical protein [Geminicoccaceae bacterium]